MRLLGNMYKTITITFIISGLWDVLLRKLSENFDKLPISIKNTFPFIGYLTPYFEKHTLLDAALIAGFVAACTQAIILNILLKYPKFIDLYYLLGITFVVSALFGFVMKVSNLFPNLDETYYKELGTLRSMYHDGISGLIVQLTLILFMLYISK